MKKVTTALWIAKSLAEQFFRNSAAFRELAPINPPFKSSRGATICGRTAGSGGWAQGPAGRSENARGPTGSGVGGTLEGRNGIRRSTRVCVQLLSRCTRCSSLRIAGVSPAAPIYAVPPPPPSPAAARTLTPEGPLIIERPRSHRMRIPRAQVVRSCSPR